MDCKPGNRAANSPSGECLTLAEALGSTNASVAPRVGTRGCGPFVALAATDNKVPSGVGIGFLYGWKTAATDPEGFSIGLGAVLDADVKDMAAEFVLKEPPPANETAVRFTTFAVVDPSFRHAQLLTKARCSGRC